MAFVVTLGVASAMLSLPTSSQSGQQISAFYAAHATLILIQQVLGVVALGFLIGFGLALGARRRRPLLGGIVLVAIAELATNVVPSILALTTLGPDGAHKLTVIEDVADEVLFVGVGVFSFAATIGEVRWVRAAGIVVAALSLGRVLMTPFGIGVLEVVAPLAFLALILLLSVRCLLGWRIQPVV